MRYIDVEKIPMSKYIDAEQFKQDNERLLHCDFPYLSEETLEELIDNAPAADVEPKWIPCSERLPEEDYETGNGVQFSADVLATIVDHKNDGELYVWLLKTVDGKWYDYIPNEDGSQEVPYGCEVIAWMPLPEPYKGGEKEC